MTIDQAEQRRQRRAAAKVVMVVGLRSAATTAALIAAYYLIPVRAKTHTQQLLWLLAALAVFAAIVAFQLRIILNSPHPRQRAVEGWTMGVPLFLIVFARIYLTLSTYTSDAFSSNLDRSGCLYFTITVFSTVGFGDITPKTGFARLIASAQMLLDLVLFGAIVKLLLGAVQRNIATKTAEPPGSNPTT